MRIEVLDCTQDLQIEDGRLRNTPEFSKHAHPGGLATSLGRDTQADPTEPEIETDRTIHLGSGLPSA